MLELRRAKERGHANFGWLDSHHTFSFGDYVDPRHMGFRSLRVINEDRVEAGRGFGTHGHRDMEIVSYVIEGALEHKDSLGTGAVIRPGDVQRMTAGTGVTHSEFNHSKTEGVHFLQIWILPDRARLEPGYEQKNFPVEERKDQLRLVASNDGREGSVVVHQDAAIFAAVLGKGTKVTHPLADGRHGWVQIIRGAVTIDGQRLGPGDGAGVREAKEIAIQAEEEAELLVFDLA